MLQVHLVSVLGLVLGEPLEVLSVILRQLGLRMLQFRRSAYRLCLLAHAFDALLRRSILLTLLGFDLSLCGLALSVYFLILQLRHFHLRLLLLRLNFRLRGHDGGVRLLLRLRRRRIDDGIDIIDADD